MSVVAARKAMAQQDILCNIVMLKCFEWHPLFSQIACSLEMIITSNDSANVCTSQYGVGHICSINTP